MLRSFRCSPGRTRLRTLAILLAVLTGAAGAAVVPAAWAAVTLPVRILKGHGAVLVVASVQIRGHSYPFIIDTGASKSSVDVHLARLLHLRRVGRPVRVHGVGGVALERIYRLPAWQLSGVPLPAANVGGSHLVTNGSGPAGLVGSDVLARFGRVAIDYQNGLLTLGR